MFLIVSNGRVIATADRQPNLEDAAGRGDLVIERQGRIGQLWDGEILTDPEEIESVPKTASKLRLYESLNESGDWPQIEAALAADHHAYNSWMFAQVIDRNHPLIEQFRQALGWTVEQVDDLFKAAQ